MAEKFSGRPGEYFTLEQTLSGIEAILNGTEDQPAEQPQAEKPAENSEQKPEAQTQAPAETEDKPEAQAVTAP